MMKGSTLMYYQNTDQRRNEAIGAQHLQEEERQAFVAHAASLRNRSLVPQTRAVLANSAANPLRSPNPLPNAGKVGQQYFDN